MASAQTVLKVPSQYKTIQSAINAARDKDTVLVAPGVYTENWIDFKGKTLVVISAEGASRTTIQRKTEIRFSGTQGRDAVLEGFTIIGHIRSYGSPTIRNNVIRGGYYTCPCTDPAIHSTGGSPLIIGNVITGHSCITGLWPPPSAAIHSESGSPHIVNNLITNNHTDMDAEFTDAEVRGGAIYIKGAAYIAGNVITNNWIWARGDISPPTPCRTYGGGLYLHGPSTVVNNIIAFNSAASEGFSSTVAHVSEGGGIYCASSATITNNTIYGNSVRVQYGTSSRGGGIYGGTITNSILWGNSANHGGDVYNPAAVRYCNVSTGFPGTGNISQNPGFLNPGGRDFHLPHASPCRDRGTHTVLAGITVDFEGDPRIGYGTVDMGADEFFPRLSHSGTPTPGGKIQVDIIGDPGQLWYWAYSSGVLNPPATIPGLHGFLHLNPAAMGIIPMGVFPNTRVSGFSFEFPPTFPRISIPIQALMGTQLSNLNPIDVK